MAVLFDNYFDNRRVQQKNTSMELRIRLQMSVADRIFDELDSDQSGMLDIHELALLAKRLGQRWAKKDLLLYFDRMVRLGLYPIVTFQYSSTTLFQISYHIQYLFF